MDTFIGTSASWGCDNVFEFKGIYIAGKDRDPRILHLKNLNECSVNLDNKSIRFTKKDNKKEGTFTGESGHEIKWTVNAGVTEGMIFIEQFIYYEIKDTEKQLK